MNKEPLSLPRFILTNCIIEKFAFWDAARAKERIKSDKLPFRVVIEM